MFNWVTSWFRKPEPQRKRYGLILLVPPEVPMGPTIKYIMELNGYTNCEEIEPKAGCKRVRLS